MAGVVKAPGAFAITPHKVSVCILVNIYASPSQISVPFPFSSVSQHNRLGLYLLALTKVFPAFSPFSFQKCPSLLYLYFAFGIKWKVKLKLLVLMFAVSNFDVAVM